MKKFLTLSTCLLAIGGYANALSISGIGGTGQIKPNTSLATKVANSKLALAHSSDVQAFVGDKIEVPHPGSGFDSRTGLAYTSMCLANANDPNAVVYSNPEGVLNFTSSVTGEELASYLNANVSGSADFGLFSASISANYVCANSDTHNRLSFNYVQAMNLDAAYQIPSFGTAKAFTQDAQDALTYGRDVFTNYCGDSFVSSAKVGAILVISANIEFASKAKKEAFEGSASGSIAGIGSISGAFKQESKSSTSDATMNISIIQQGGDVSKLAEALGKPGDKGYYAVSCSSGDTTDCDNAINAAIAYTQNYFEKSIDLTDPTKRANYYTWNTNYKSYKSIGVGVTFPVLTPQGLAAKQYLVKQVQADRDMLAYLQRYQKQPFYSSTVDPETKDQTSQAIKDYKFIVNQYTQMGIIYSCYGAGSDVSSKCIDAAQAVEKVRGQYQDSIIRARGLSLTYLVMGPIQFKAVSIRDWGFIDYSHILGDFIPYDIGTNQFINNQTCVFDTTVDNAYITYEPELAGKYMECLGSNPVFSRNNLYVARGGNTFLGGVMGFYKNGVHTNFPVYPTGANTQLLISSDEFTYNPI